MHNGDPHLEADCQQPYEAIGKGTGAEILRE
jgi:hypothetical protein